MNYSPWGPPQQVTILLDAPRIIQVETAGHGGVCLSIDAEAIMLQRTGVPKSPFLKNNWYEEDLDAIMVSLAFWEELAIDPAKVVKWCGMVGGYEEGYYPTSFVTYCQQLIDKLL
jgi:hypothetical protein